MNDAVRKYLADIGRKGGQKSRKKLDPETARKMGQASGAARAAKAKKAKKTP